MNDPIDLILLRSFVAVIDCGSIQLAADRVGRSQSAVSMQIKRLEQEIGVPLFQKEGRSLRANAAGHDLLIYARRMLRLSDEVKASLRQPDAVGKVRLGFPEDYAAHLMAPILAGFAQEFPLAEIELTFETTPVLLRLLEAGKIDVALITSEPDQRYEVLRQERFVWAAAKRYGAWLRDPLPVALFDAGDIARRIALEALQAHDKPYRLICSTPSLLGLIAVAQAGLAVVGLVESCVPPGLIRLSEADGLPGLPMLNLSIVRGAGEQSNMVANLTDYLIHELRNDTRS